MAKNLFYLPWLRRPPRLPRIGAPIPDVTAAVVDGIERFERKSWEKHKARSERRVLPPEAR